MPKKKEIKEVTFNPEVAKEEDSKEVAEEKEATEVADVTNEVTITNPSTQKKVKVRLRVNHSCNIGGEFYHFTKDEVYTVPVNVKRVLSEADLLKSL